MTSSKSLESMSQWQIKAYAAMVLLVFVGLMARVYCIFFVPPITVTSKDILISSYHILAIIFFGYQSQVIEAKMADDYNAHLLLLDFFELTLAVFYTFSLCFPPFFRNDPWNPNLSYIFMSLIIIEQQVWTWIAGSPKAGLWWLRVVIVSFLSSVGFGFLGQGISIHWVVFVFLSICTALYIFSLERLLIFQNLSFHRLSMFPKNAHKSTLSFKTILTPHLNCDTGKAETND